MFNLSQQSAAHSPTLPERSTTSTHLLLPSSRIRPALTGLRLMCVTALNLVTPTPSFRTVLLLLAFVQLSTSSTERTLLLSIFLQASMSVARPALLVRQHLQLLRLVRLPRHPQLLPRPLHAMRPRQPQLPMVPLHLRLPMALQHLRHPPRPAEQLKLGSLSASGDPALSISGALGGSVTT